MPPRISDFHLTGMIQKEIRVRYDMIESLTKYLSTTYLNQKRRSRYYFKKLSWPKNLLLIGKTVLQFQYAKGEIKMTQKIKNDIIVKQCKQTI